MSERKTRSDKGIRRKPPETARETALDFFAELTKQEQEHFLDSCRLIQRYAGVQPKAHAVTFPLQNCEKCGGTVSEGCCCAET